MNSKQFRADILKTLKEIGITPKVTEVVKKPEYIAYLNTLRGMKGVLKSLHETFDEYRNIEIVEVWIRSSECTCMTPFGTASYDKLELLTQEPIISCDFLHLVAVHCEDENLLKYVEWSVEKHLNELNALKSLGDKSEEQKDNKKLKSLKKEDVDSFVKELFSNIHL